MRLHFVPLLFLVTTAAVPGAADHAPGTLVFDAADYHVGRTSSGARTSTETDLRAHGRHWVKLPVARDGDWLQLHLPTVPPGRYRVSIRAVDHPATPAADVAIGEADARRFQHLGSLPAGTNQEHRHWIDYRFRDIDVGEASLDLPGFRTIRFTTRGPVSREAAIGIDAVVLTPVTDPRLVAPTRLRAEAPGPVNVTLRWSLAGSADAAGLLIERRGPPFPDWRACGYTPGDATQFIATGLYPNSRYTFRVRPWTASGAGPASAEVGITTAPVEQAWRGAEILGSGPSRGRAGEGSLFSHPDGRMVMFYNAQERTDDFAGFSIFRTESQDEGATWSPGRPERHDPAGRIGYLMPSLLRLQDGRLGFSYARRDNASLAGHRVYRVSDDNGATWSEEAIITTDLPLTELGYTFTGATGPHDRLIQAANGDLFLPVHLTTGKGTNDIDPFHDRAGHLLVSATVVYRSTDLGRSWRRVFGPVLLKGTLQTAPYAYQWIDQLLSEPALVETAPGRLLLHMRNPSGFFYQARSDDHGGTWTPVHQSPINAPLSPAKLVRIAPGVIGMAFNSWVDPHGPNLGRRFALGTMISHDEGRTWDNFKLLDLSDPADRPGNFCYPFFHREGPHLHTFYFARGLSMSYRRLPGDWWTSPTP